MTTYSSVRQIKDDFQITSDDLQEIREFLNKIRIENHPDRTNGDFDNEGVKERYYNANNAIMFLDTLQNNQSLVVVEKMTDLMRVVTELIPNSKQNSLEQTLDSKISFAISTFRSKLFIPKISLTAITAIVTFIFLFPGRIKDDPALSRIIDPSSLGFLTAWFMSLTYSGLFWFMTFSNEERSKRKLMLLKVDSVQNGIFNDFINSELKDNIFTKDELTDFVFESSLGNKIGDRHRISVLNILNHRLFGSEIITLEIAQNIAELIIARGEKNQVIAKLSRNTLSETYMIKSSRHSGMTT